MPTPLTPVVAPTGSTPEAQKIISGINDTIGKINTNVSTGATTGTTTPPPSTTAITADRLAGTTSPPTITPPSPVAGSTALASTLAEAAQSNMATDAYTAGLDAAKNSTEASKNKSFSDYINNLLGNKGQTELTADEYANTGVDQAQADLRDINQKIIAEQHSNLREIQALKENAAGYVGSGLSDKIQEVQDKSTSRQADMAILQLASQGKYDSAKAIADRAVAVKFERQKTINEALQLNYQENKDLFTKAEQRQFETAQADRNRKLDMDVYKEKARYEQVIKQNDPLYQQQLAKLRKENSSLVQNGLSYEDNQRLNATPQAKALNDGARFASALQAYKEAINTHGTGEVFGAGSGEINSAYQTVVGAIKDYYSLGTLDNGVEKLVALGIPAPSIFGQKSARIGGIDEQIKGVVANMDRNATQLKSSAFGNTAEAQNLISNVTNVKQTLGLNTVSNENLLKMIPTTGGSPIDNSSFFNSFNTK